MLRRSLIAMSVLVLPLSFGCGGGNSYDGPARVAVSGTVSLDGQPVQQGSIIFEPDGKGRRADGVIASGKFTIPEKLGPNEGKYTVRITGIMNAEGDSGETPVGEDAGDDTSGDATGGQDSTFTDQGIPAKFNKESTLTADIKTGMEPLTFDLKK